MASAGLCVTVSVCQCLVCICASLWCVSLCVLHVGRLHVWGVCLWVAVSVGVVYIWLRQGVWVSVLGMYM